jgi:hypothetical protein
LYIISPKELTRSNADGLIVTKKPAPADARFAIYGGEEQVDLDVLQARTEVWKSMTKAKYKRSPKRKRDKQDYDDENHTFYDAHTGLSDDEEDYFSAVEEQPAVWPILRRRRARGKGKKRVSIRV